MLIRRNIEEMPIFNQLEQLNFKESQMVLPIENEDSVKEHQILDKMSELDFKNYIKSKFILRLLLRN